VTRAKDKKNVREVGYEEKRRMMREMEELKYSTGRKCDARSLAAITIA
jgi:hypothetical protein